MKTLKFSLLALLIIAFSASASYSQINVNKLKNNAKDKVKDGVKTNKKDKNEKNDETNVSDDNSNTETDKKDNKIVNIANEPSQEYVDLINNTYSMIKSYEDGLNITNIQRGDVWPHTHLESAKKLDYPNTIKTMEENGRDGVTGYKYDDIIKYGEDYKATFESNLKLKINTSIEQAYKVRESNQQMAIEEIEKAMQFAEAATLIIPEVEETHKLFQDAKNAWDDIAGDYYKEVYTSDFHKENVGKILFSKNPIEIGKEDPSQFSTEFTPEDHIYAVVYLKSKIGDLGKSSKYEVSVDGGYASYISFGHNEQDLDKSYYLIEIIPDPNEAVHKLDPVEFAKILAPLSPRSHEMSIGMAFGYDDPVATGKVNLNWAGVDGEKIKQNADLAAKNASDNWARNQKLPEVYSMPSQSFDDPALSLSKVKSIFMAATPSATQILKVVITEPANSNGEWIIFKNDIDIPTSKRTNRYAYFIYKANDGWCYFTDGSFFYRDYEGGGKYSNIKISGCKVTRIACENVK